MELKFEPMFKLPKLMFSSSTAFLIEIVMEAIASKYDEIKYIIEYGR